MNLPRVVARRGDEAYDAAFLIETRQDGRARYGRVYDETTDEWRQSPRKGQRCQLVVSNVLAEEIAFEA